MKLPVELQDSIREYMLHTQNLNESQKEMNKFIEMLSPSLKNEVLEYIFIAAFELNDAFKGDHKNIKALIQGILPCMQRPDDIVVEQGDSSTHFFFIADGTCQVTFLDHWKQEVEVDKELDKGKYFGEIGILN